MWCSSRDAGDAARGTRINLSDGFWSILKIHEHTEPSKNGVLEISRNNRERSRRGLIRSEGKADEQGFGCTDHVIAYQASNYFALRLLGVSTEGWRSAEPAFVSGRRAHTQNRLK
jgi:hypothetical protein